MFLLRQIPVVSSLLPAMAPLGPQVAVIALNGVISRPSGNPLQDRGSFNIEKLRKWADAAFALKNVQAVALDINCPGGAPAQCELMHSYLRAKSNETKVPVFAFANDVAASGGYWMMCAGEELYTCRTSLVGSIGVISPGFVFKDAIARLGVQRRVMASGKSKIGADPFSDITPEQEALQQSIMRSLHESFIDLVKLNRKGKLKGSPEDLFSGRVWAGKEAVDLGLVDAIGDLDSVLREKYGNKVTKVVFGRPPVTRWSFFSPAVLGSSFWAGMEQQVLHTVEAAWDKVQERTIWAKYGM